jgi:putative endonuclease
MYILKSQINGQYYIGQTQDLTLRLVNHNAGKVRSTKSKKPWVLLYSEAYVNRSKAFARESQIKSWKSRKAIERLIQNN